MKHKINLPCKILIGTHHKTGTVWMISLFKAICNAFKLRFFVGEQNDMPDDFHVFLQNQSKFDFELFPFPYKGLHLIRDPRDMLVSGCFYHQTSSEKWLHVKRENLEGMTYQEKINSYKDLEDKILFEMEHSGRHHIRKILQWDYKNADFFEVKYEDLIADKDLMIFHKIFTFLGFPGKAIPELLKISYTKSLFSGSVDRPGHIRSGRPQQWKEHFTPKLKDKFIELFGDALIELGYEKNNDWKVKNG